MSRKLSPWCKKVKKKLIDLDMTTTELAEVIGLSRGHVSATSEIIELCGEELSTAERHFRMHYTMERFIILQITEDSNGSTERPLRFQAFP